MVLPDSPLCVAPWTAALIDPDKGVRPCCNYFVAEGTHMPGSHAIARLGAGVGVREVFTGADWQAVRDQLAVGEVPEGCRTCIAREATTGGSSYRDYYADPDWRRGITFLEFNTSNICTLQCRHCDGRFSHRWARIQGLETHAADTATLLDSLRDLDLSHLKRVMFKGGEPLLNPDLPAVLEHLRSIGRLPHVQVEITTNGSVIRDELRDVLRQARSSRIALSVDGVDALQTYIRHGRSDLERIEAFVTSFAAVPRIAFDPIVSIMVYNAFRLDQIVAWWTALARRVGRPRGLQRLWHRKGKVRGMGLFHFVTDPPYLALNCLQDATRSRLADRYERLDPRRYTQVVRVLRQPFAGTATHDRFVIETLLNDALLGRSVFDAAPELREEFVLLDPEGARAEIGRRVGDGVVDAERGRSELELVAGLVAGSGVTAN